jgi:hypothetical protein
LALALRSRKKPLPKLFGAAAWIETPIGKTGDHGIAMPI